MLLLIHCKTRGIPWNLSLFILLRSLSSMIYLLWNEFGSDYFKHAAIFRRVAAVQIFVRLLLWIWQLNAPLVELITDMSLSAISDITISLSLITQIPWRLLLLQMEVMFFIITFSILSCCSKTLERLEILNALHCPEFKTGENGVLYFIHYLFIIIYDC